MQQVALRLPKEVVKAYEDMAEESGLDRSDLMRTALEIGAAHRNLLLERK